MEAKKLDGNLTREQRVEVAQDVLKRIMRSKKKYIIDTGSYLLSDGSRYSKIEGSLSSRDLGICQICAMGALFISSVDKYDQCNVGFENDIACIAADRSTDDWGREQIYAIENAFELYSDLDHRAPSYLFGSRLDDPRDRLRAICKNIVANDGEFVP